MAEEKNFHIPVLLNEVIQYLNLKPNKNYIDCTLGFAGYAQKILEATKPSGKYLGIDLDPKAIKESKKVLSKYGERVILVNENFVNLGEIAEKYQYNSVDGILFDLGLSSFQLEDQQRGFSYKALGDLDMRFGEKSGNYQAKDVLNKYKEEDLMEIFKKYGEFKTGQAARLAKIIIKKRKAKIIETADEFREIVIAIIPSKFKKEPILSRAFQALRIYVNDELNNLEKALQDALNILNKKGRMVCISYHSLEDRIVKNFLKRESKDCICPPEIPKCICDHQKSLKILTKKPIIAQDSEIKKNIRSRSAKMRVAQKII